MAEALNKKAYEVGYGTLVDPVRFPTILRTVEVSGVTAARGQALAFKAADGDGDAAWAAAETGDRIAAIAAKPIASGDGAADVYVAGAFARSAVKVGDAAPTEADTVAAQGNGIYIL